MFSTDLNWWIHIIHNVYISQSCIPASRSILECLSRWWLMKIIFFLEGPPTGLAIPYDEHLFWTCCFCMRFLSLHELAFLSYFEIRIIFQKDGVWGFWSANSSGTARFIAHYFCLKLNVRCGKKEPCWLMLYLIHHYRQKKNFLVPSLKHWLQYTLFFLLSISLLCRAWFFRLSYPWTMFCLYGRLPGILCLFCSLQGKTML